MIKIKTKTLGLWAYINVDYTGTVKISLNTKINLMSLKQSTSQVPTESNEKKRVRHLGMLNSDEEDSPESSGDEYTYQSKSEDDKSTERFDFLVPYGLLIFLDSVTNFVMGV